MGKPLIKTMFLRKSFPISFLIFLLLRSSISIDTVTLKSPIKDGEVLISNEETFALGFFSPAGGSSKRYVGIWYNKISEKNVVWVANRDIPINNTSGVLSINETGNIVLFESQNPEIPVWSTNVLGAKNNYSAQLMDSGNLVLFQGDNNNRVVAWQSFDYPTDTLLPNMKLGLDKRTGLNRIMTSWKSRNDPGTGEYSYKMDVNDSVAQLFLYKGSTRYWRDGPWNGLRWSGVPETTFANAGIFTVSYVDNNDEVTGMYRIINASIISRLVVNETAGILERLTWNEGEQRWVRIWFAPKDQCDDYAHCGAFSNCNPNNVGQLGCKCLPGFEPKSGQDWYLRDGSDKCVRKRGGHACGNGEGFEKVTGVKIPDTTTTLVNRSLDIKMCEELCLSNCSCTGYMTADVSKGGSGCFTWFGEIIDLREFSYGGQDLYLRVDSVELSKYKKKSKRSPSYLKVVIPVITTAAVLLILSLAYWFLMKKRRGTAEERSRELSVIPNGNDMTFFGSSSKVEEINERGTSSDLHLYSLSTIVAATDNFSIANKLGEGGFGSVFKGILHNGQEIAVKRLSNSSGQGIEEFRNEVTLIAKLQHRNLVKLLGYYIQNEEKMLIYEYSPNKGLDCFIFDEAKRSMIDWGKRFDITLGIARGMLYLHRDSRLRIIHRDLKASNVLLDASMDPKISDFGMARIVGANQMEETTKRVVGTYGYMSPEYAMQGHFSIKSDVFSFGVLLLEIISGKKNNSYYQEKSVNLIGHVWDLWRGNKSLEVVDSSLGKSYDIREVLRCIHIGLLCVQESADIRPTMSQVVFMLCNETTLPSPSQPAYIFRRLSIEAPKDLSSNSVGAISINELTMSIIEAR